MNDIRPSRPKNTLMTIWWILSISIEPQNSSLVMILMSDTSNDRSRNWTKNNRHAQSCRFAPSWNSAEPVFSCKQVNEDLLTTYSRKLGITVVVNTNLATSYLGCVAINPHVHKQYLYLQKLAAWSRWRHFLLKITVNHSHVCWFYEIDESLRETTIIQVDTYIVTSICSL